MFKIVTENTSDGQPQYLVVCDEKCGVALAGPVMGVPESIEAQNVFVQEAARQGWVIGFAAQYCPKHRERYVQKIEQSKKLVELASSIRHPALQVVKN